MLAAKPTAPKSLRLAGCAAGEDEDHGGAGGPSSERGSRCITLAVVEAQDVTAAGRAVLAVRGRAEAPALGTDPCRAVLGMSVMALNARQRVASMEVRSCSSAMPENLNTQPRSWA